MKSIYISLAFVLLLLTSCKENSKEITTQDVTNTLSADGKANSSLPDIKFEEETYDFGRITEGEKVIHSFKFKNTGGSNLIIVDAKGSCGCTTPKKPEKPILPGEEGVIEVMFASEGKSGMIDKSITVVTNCEPSTKIIYIKADIVVAENNNPNAILQKGQ